MLAAQSSLGLFLGLNTSIEGVLEVANPLDACAPLMPTTKGSIVLAIRGNCSFLDKAININNTGSLALLLYDSSDGCINMGAQENETSLIESLAIYSLSISQRSGLELFALLNDPGTGPIEVTLDPFDDEAVEPSVLLLLLMASFTVMAGALWSGHDYLLTINREGSGQRRGNELDGLPQTQELKAPHAIAFIVLASASLLILFYFLNTVVFYILLVLISISFVQSSTLLLSALARLSYSPLNTRQLTVPVLGEMMLSELASLPIAVIAVVWWAANRNEPNSWILGNLLGISLMLLCLRVLTVQSIQVATTLLMLAFCYDIFWVFLSPLFFGSSVMVTVARGGSSGENLPMLLKVPSFSLPYEFTQYSMLGYGDVIIPGLLVAFLRRFEIHNQHISKGMRVSYFVLSSFSYALGLLLTFAALLFSWFGDQGQPALLYLVPCTLGSTFLLAYSREEVMELWKGISEADGEVDARPEDVHEEEGQPLMSSNPDREAMEP